VRVADHAVAQGDAVLSTIGLGSCVAIALHDAESMIGALAHILLPTPSMSRDASNLSKFPETAVPLMLGEMHRLGSRGQIVARIAGGASMFPGLSPVNGAQMGERNIAATRAALAKAGIALVGEDTGGGHGRSVFFHVRNGRMLIRSLQQGSREL
jgi:chemotaxis protein CheD